MSHPLRVLVVDDNQDAADGLTKVIRLWGHEVRSAYDETAISLMHEFQPDVVLLDVGMPRMDGHTMAPQLRANLQSSQLTIIAVTGFHDEVTERRCYDAGFDHFLVKPVDTAVLEGLLVACQRAKGGRRGA
jgi:CheY-like chemotaxis protein